MALESDLGGHPRKLILPVKEGWMIEAVDDEDAGWWVWDDFNQKERLWVEDWFLSAIGAADNAGRGAVTNMELLRRKEG
jgi:hypothetical protein